MSSAATIADLRYLPRGRYHVERVSGVGRPIECDLHDPDNIGCTRDADYRLREDGNVLVGFVCDFCARKWMEDNS